MSDKPPVFLVEHPDPLPEVSLSMLPALLAYLQEPVCGGRCYALTESGAGYIDPACPKHGAVAVGAAGERRKLARERDPGVPK